MASDDPHERMMERLMEWQADAFDRMNTYTNLVMAGGYVGAFALWSFSKCLSGKILNRESRL
jgi:hypothetical protein